MFRFQDVDLDYEGRKLTEDDIFGIGKAILESKYGIFDQDDLLHEWAKKTEKEEKNISELLDDLRILAKKLKKS